MDSQSWWRDATYVNLVLSYSSATLPARVDFAQCHACYWLLRSAGAMPSLSTGTSLLGRDRCGADLNGRCACGVAETPLLEYPAVPLSCVPRSHVPLSRVPLRTVPPSRRCSASLCRASVLSLQVMSVKGGRCTCRIHVWPHASTDAANAFLIIACATIHLSACLSRQVSNRPVDSRTHQAVPTKAVLRRHKTGVPACAQDMRA